MKLRVTCNFTFQNNFSVSNGVSNFVPENCSLTDKWLRMVTDRVLQSSILSTEEN